MRRLIKNFIFLLIVLLPTFSWAVEWEQWSPAGERFHIDLPKGYTPSDTNLDNNQNAAKDYFNAWAVIPEVGYYEGSYTLLPAGAINADANLASKMLDAGRDNLLKGTPGAKLRTDNRMTVNGYPAMELVVDNMDLTGVTAAPTFGTFRSVSVLRQDRLFQAIYIGKTGTESSEDVQKFLASVNVE